MNASVLCVDDDENVLRSYRRHLSPDFELATAASPVEGLRLVQNNGPFAVIVSDHMMPELSGVEFLERCAEIAPSSIRIMLTGCAEFDIAIKAVNSGSVFRFLSKPCPVDDLKRAVRAGMDQYHLLMERQSYTQRLEERVREQTDEIRLAHEETIHRLATASAYRDQETGAHIRRVGLFSQALATAAGWSATKAAQLRLAAPMHDVGKIGIPDVILQKPGKLTADEFRIMKTHTMIGADMLSGSSEPVLQLASQIARSHHERWDSCGYPDGLAGGSIPEAARIVSIVDVYDALTHDRVYRPALPEAEVLVRLADGRAKHHDPRLVDAFLDILPLIQLISSENPDERDAQDESVPSSLPGPSRYILP